MLRSATTSDPIFDILGGTKPGDDRVGTREPMQDQSSTLRMMVAECLELSNKYLDIAKTAVHPDERFEITRMAIHCNAAAFELETYLKPPSASDPRKVKAARSRFAGAALAAEALFATTVAQLRGEAATLCERARTFSDATLREQLLVLAAECEQLGPKKRRGDRSNPGLANF